MEDRISARGSTALVAAVGAGILAIILGVSTLMSYGNHLMDMGNESERAIVWPGHVALLQGRAIAVIALIATAMLFTVLAGFGLAMRARREVRIFVPAVAVLEVLMGALVLGGSWSDGWANILDLSSARPFVAMVALQVIALGVAGVVALLPSRAET